MACQLGRWWRERLPDQPPDGYSAVVQSVETFTLRSPNKEQEHHGLSGGSHAPAQPRHCHPHGASPGPPTPDPESQHVTQAQPFPSSGAIAPGRGGVATLSLVPARLRGDVSRGPQPDCAFPPRGAVSVGGCTGFAGLAWVLL